jgi:hypothetical protein
MTFIFIDLITRINERQQLVFCEFGIYIMKTHTHYPSGCTQKVSRCTQDRCRRNRVRREVAIGESSKRGSNSNKKFIA